MGYIQQSDIEDIFGTVNVAVWSNLTNDSETPDTNRIAIAIASAEQEVNDRFRQSWYAIPFMAVGANGLRPVIGWCAALAGAWLFRPRLMRGQGGDAAALVLGQRSAALEEMDLYLAGSRQLECAPKVDQTDAPAVV